MSLRQFPGSLREYQAAPLLEDDEDVDAIGKRPVGCLSFKRPWFISTAFLVCPVFHSFSLHRASSSKSSSLGGGGVTRTASVHVPAVPHQKVSHTDSSTQTDLPSGGSRFSRSFSIVGRKKQPALDEDVAQLVEACRRYQVRGSRLAKKTGLRMRK